MPHNDSAAKQRDQLIVAFALEQFMKEKKIAPATMRENLKMNDSTFSRLMNGKRSLKFRESVVFCDTLSISLDDFGKTIDAMKSDPIFAECFTTILRAEQESMLAEAKAMRHFKERKLT